MTAPETNGEVCYQAFHHEEEHVGLPLVDLAEPTRSVTMTFYDLTRQPRRTTHQPVLDRHDERRPRLLRLVHER